MTPILIHCSKYLREQVCFFIPHSRGLIALFLPKFQFKQWSGRMLYTTASKHLQKKKKKKKKEIDPMYTAWKKIITVPLNILSSSRHTRMNSNAFEKRQQWKQYTFQIAKSMGPTWGPPGSCRPQWVSEWLSLTHWGRDKMAAISQTIFSNAFSWIKMYEFRLSFHWSLFPRVQLTKFQH